MAKPKMCGKCYECKHREGIPGDCHSSCTNRSATVVGAERGIANGWFVWPYNFDPTWLEACDGFKPRAVR